MTNNDINTYIQQLLEPLQEQFQLPGYELDTLFGFFKILVNRADDPENICPCGMLVQYEKSGSHLRDSFLEAFSSALRKLPISRKYSIAEINEKFFSDDSTLPGVLGLRNAVNALSHQESTSDTDVSSIIFLLKNCSEIHSLDHLISEFERYPEVIKIICATNDVVENRFRKNDHFFYRLIPDHIHLQHAPSAHVIKDFLQLMTDTGFRYDDGFESEISYYVDTIYKEADYKDSDFNQDLLRRIELRMEKEDGIRAYKNSLIVDRSFVPYSSKVVAAKSRAESKEPTTPMNTQLQKDTDDHNIQEINEAETHRQGHRFTKERDHVNVLLLALSTFPFSKGIMKSNFQYINADGSIITVVGRYQLDPVPKLLDELLAGNGETLDRIIILGTEVTRMSVDVTTPEKEKRRISPEDYFKQQVTNYMNPDIPERQRFVSITVSEDNPYAGISAVVNEMRNCSEELAETLSCNNLSVNLYIDTHGGLRGTQRILEATTLLLEKTNSDKIKLKQAFSIEMKGKDETNIIRDETENVKIFDFVAGVNEFISCGRADTLNKYAKSENLSDNALVSGIRAVALGIQLCNIPQFEEGLEKLQKYFNRENNTELNDGNHYLDIYRNDIKADYGKLVSGNYDCVDEIKWCYRHGFYQQAITLAESKTPTLLLDEWKLLKFMYNERQKEYRCKIPCGMIVETVSYKIEKRKNKYFINNTNKPYTKNDFFNGLVYTFVEELIKDVKPTIRISNGKRPHYIFDSNILKSCKSLKDLKNYSTEKLGLNDDDISACIDRALITTSLEKDILCPNIIELTEKGSKNKPELFQFFALHKYLKDIRNNMNHAVDNNPYDLDIVEHMLSLYTDLLDKLNPNKL